MKSSDQNIFIKHLKNYFLECSGVPISIDPPRLKENQIVVLDYTGIIGISGQKSGTVYLTAGEKMLRELAGKILGNGDVSIEDIKDLVGEIANIISGNVRKDYGSGFLLTVPVIIEGNVRDIKLPVEIHPVVFPFTWKTYKAFLVVGLK